MAKLGGALLSKDIPDGDATGHTSNFPVPVARHVTALQARNGAARHGMTLTRHGMT